MNMSEPRLTKEQMEMAGKLSHLQRTTVIHMASGMGRVKAYHQAGGKTKSPKVASDAVGKMLEKDGVKAFYESLIEAMASRSIMTRQEAMERLTKTARVGITDIAEFRDECVGEDEDGDPIYRTNWRIKDSDEMSPEASSAIKSVTATKSGHKLELHDPQGAIKQISDMQGWAAPSKHEHTGKDGQPMQLQADVTSPEIAAAVQEVMSRL